MLQVIVIKLSIKNNHVKVVWHDHIRIDPQPLFLDATLQAVYNDLSRLWINENRQPIEDGEGDVINIYAVYETETIHRLIILRINLET